MPPIRQAVLKLESDPEFQALSYHEQQIVRQQVYSKTFQSDPEFARLGDQDKIGVVQTFIERPPVFQNPAVGQQVNGIMQQMKQGDAAARDLAIGTISSQALRDKSLVFNFAFKGAEAVKRMLPESGLNTEAVLKLSGKDTRKASAYFRQVFSEDRKALKRISRDETIAAIGGFVVDTAVTQAVAAPFIRGGLAVAAKTQTGKALVTGTEKLIKGPFSRAMVQHAKQLPREILESVVGTSREIALDLVNETKDPKEVLALDNIGSNFGSYLAGDILFWGALGVLKGQMLGLKAAFRGFKGESLRKAALETSGLVKDAFSLKLSDTVIDQIQNVESRNYLKAIKTMGEFHSLERIVPGSPEWVRTLGAASHLAVDVDKAGKWVVSEMDGTSKKTFSSIDAVSNFLSSRNNQSPLTKLTKDDLALELVTNPDIDVKQTITKKLDLSEAKLADKMMLMVTPQAGQYNRRNLQVFAKTYLGELGVDPDVADKLVFKTADDALDKVSLIDGNTVSVPRGITNTADVKVFADKLMSSLDLVAGGKAKSEAATSVGRRLLDNFDDKKFFNQFYPEGWVNDAAEASIGGSLRKTPEGKYRIELPNGSSQDFDTISDAGNFVVRQNLDEDLVRKHLRSDHGLSLKKTKSGFELRKNKGNQIVGSFASLDELLDKNPAYLPKIPSYLQTKYNFVDGNAARVSVQKGVARGDMADMMGFLSRFKDYSKENFDVRLPLGNKKLTFSRATHKYTIEVPEIGHRETFKSRSEAVKFAEKGWKDFDELEKAAYTKGYRLSLHKGQYLLYSRGTKPPIAARSKGELYAALKKVETPEHMQDLGGISQEFYDTLKRPDGSPVDIGTAFDDDMYKLINDTENFTVRQRKLLEKTPERAVEFLGKRKEKLVRRGALSFFTPLTSSIKDVASAYGDLGKRAVSSMEDVITTRRLADAEIARVGNEIEELFKVGGRKLSDKRLRRLGQVLKNETDPAQWDKIASQIGITLNDADRTVMQRFRDFLGTDNTKGLFAKFGVDGNRFVSNYMPRIKDQSFRDLGRLIKDDTDWGTFNQMFARSELKDLTPFFEHGRVSDLVAFSTEDNLRNILHRYSQVGHRNQVMKESLKKLDDFMKTSGGEGILPIELQNKLVLFRDQMLGMPTGAQKQLQKGLTLLTLKAADSWLGRALNLSEKKATENLLSSMFKASYMGTMAFRPWLPVRNIQQIWTTLAPRVGNDTVMKAIKRLDADKQGKIASRLRQTGFFSNKPIFGFDENISNKLLDTGLKWYKNSDEYTRVIAFTSAAELLEDSTKRLLKGDINQEQFLKLSRLNQMDVFTRQRVVSHLRSNQFDSAVDLYGKALSDETMFIYEAYNRPQGFIGNVGRLFGQMGTYPISYTKSVLNGLSRSQGLGEKLAFASTVALNSAALYGAATALGIKGTNFLPHYTSVLHFSGGPYYQMLNDVLQVGGPDWQRKQAFTRLKKKLPTVLVPGSLAFKGLQRAIGYAEEGEYWKAFLAGTSAPIRK